MTKEAQCCAKVKPPGDWRLRPHPCRNLAKVTRDGNHYCTIHDPVRVAEREEKTRKQRRLDLEAESVRTRHLRAVRDAEAQVLAQVRQTGTVTPGAVKALAAADAKARGETSD